jgi:hypothetical protein
VVVVEVEVVDVVVVVAVAVVVVGIVVVVLGAIDVVGVVVEVEAATVVEVVAGGGDTTAAVTVDDPVTERRRKWITPAVVIDDEPIAMREASGASMPELVRISFEEPSMVRSALLPGAKLIEGVAGVLPFNVNCEEPVTTIRPPVSLLHARVSFAAVPHARTSTFPVAA